MPEILGLDPKSYAYVMYFIYLFSTHPDKEFSPKELYEEFEKITSPTTPSKNQLYAVLEFLVNSTIITQNKKPITYRYISKPTHDESLRKTPELIHNILKDDIPIPEKVKILVPFFLHFAYTSFLDILNAPLTNDPSHSLQISILAPKMLIQRLLKSLNPSDRRKFLYYLNKMFQMLAESKADVYEEIHQSYLNYINPRNKEDSKSSSSPATRSQDSEQF